jgi:hypothetical protein
MTQIIVSHSLGAVHRGKEVSLEHFTTFIGELDIGSASKNVSSYCALKIYVGLAAEIARMNWGPVGGYL